MVAVACTWIVFAHGQAGSHSAHRNVVFCVYAGIIGQIMKSLASFLKKRQIDEAGMGSAFGHTGR